MISFDAENTLFVVSYLDLKCYVYRPNGTLKPHGLACYLFQITNKSNYVTV